MSFDWKCALTNAILTVLVYLLFVRLLGADSGKNMGESVQWYKSLEYMLLVSTFVAYNLNTVLFTSCSSA